MKDNSDYFSLSNYRANTQTTTFPGFGPQDEALKNFTQRKRNKTTKKTQNQSQKRYEIQGVVPVRINVIEGNLLLIEDTSKGLQTSKSYPLRARNPINEDMKSRIPKLVAYSLLKKGFGFNLYQQYIEEQNAQSLMLACQKYKSTTISIMQRTFRRIQQFLKVQCQKRIKSLKYEQIRCLIRYISKFNIYFQKNEAATMAKFISLAQELHPVVVSSNQALNLYSAILKILKMVQAGKSVNPVVEQPVYERTERKKKSWGVKQDKQLIQFYQLNQSYSKIHKCIISIHPELSEDISVQFIQQQIERIFRQILRKLKQFSRKRGFQELIELNENKSNYIIKSPACSQLRLALLDFYQIDHVSDQAAFNTIVSTINDKFNFSPDNGNRKSCKDYKVKQGLKASLEERTRKYVRTLDQQTAQDWSKSATVIPRLGYCIKENHYQIRNVGHNIKQSRFEPNSEEEYSDS